ncbi:MAG: hypothetical protein M3Z46_08440 [Actinomycetota bacterium]|nr:hypothetical protein [Actinomycetota bacterium]
MRRTLVTVLIGVAVLMVTAGPASAHSVAGQGGTNYKSRLKSINPHVAGLKVQIIEAGSRIKLTNHTGQTVSILGYSDEPYLRIGKDGVFENVRSPTLYTNSVRNNPPAPPPEADPTAKPVWKRTGGGDVVRWHDHRAHWMGGQDPPIVKRAPGKFHIVNAAWRLKLLVGTRPVTVTGDLVWVPGPSPIPWALVGIGVAAVVVAGAFATGGWRFVLAGATVLVIAADVVHTVGVAFASEGGNTSRVLRLITSTPYSLAAWIIGAVGIVLLFRRPLEGLYGVSIAAIVIGGLGGLGDVADLFRSQLASFVGIGLLRASIALSLGLAVGIPAASYIVVRRGYVPRRASEPGSEPPIASPAATTPA